MAKKLKAKRSNSATQIKSIIERTERLMEEKKALQGDITEVLQEAKSNGFDVKIIRRIIRERARDAAEMAEEEAIYETYAMSIGHGDFDDGED